MRSVVDRNVVMRGIPVYHSRTYNHLPADLRSRSKHVEDILKIKILV